jgi:hypothetical protein
MAFAGRMEQQAMMAFYRTVGGHRFDFSSGVCLRCEMTREYYQHNGEPRCVGYPPFRKSPRKPPDNDDPPRAARWRSTMPIEVFRGRILSTEQLAAIRREIESLDRMEAIDDECGR